MQANREILSEAEIDDMIGLLDSCLSSPWQGGALQLPGTAPDDSDCHAASITKKQLRALGKEHLLIMLRDAEKELAREREKNGYLLRAYQTMRAQAVMG